MWTTADRRWPRRTFVAITGLFTVIHAVLPGRAGAVTYLSICIVATASVGFALRDCPHHERRPWQILIGAMAVLTVGNGVIAAAGTAQNPVGRLFITLGHVLLLSAAIVLVWRRGRNDVGGLLDTCVAAIGLGGLLWTSVLYPRLEVLDIPAGDQLVLLVSTLVLGGVLGALLRVRFVADRRLPALDLLIAALVLALLARILLALTAQTASERPRWIEIIFLLAILCLGAAPLHPSVHELVLPGPLPVDRLSVGRLVFLGAALAFSPVIGGVRQVLHLGADGALLAVGSLLISPLVMLRVGRLAHQRQHAEAALLHQATHDTLTGLPNRAELLGRLEAALRREQAAGTPGVVLLFCDLNGFKAVNDRLGHVVGDQLLIEVAGRLSAALRADDTLARYGGDEFLVLCESPAQDDAVSRLCADISAALAAPFLLAGEDVRISTSIGAVTSSGHTTADDLITHADQLMYRNKQRQRQALAWDDTTRPRSTATA